MGSLSDEIEEIYGRRFVAFRNGLLPLTGSVDAARDAVQEGFARALRDSDQFRGEGPLEAWIWKIVFRAALASRRNGHQVALDQAVVEIPALDAERDPDLVSALHALPPRRRLVVFLRFFADLSYAQIADLCEISEGTVAATLARAREEFSRKLADEGGRS